MKNNGTWGITESELDEIIRAAKEAAWAEGIEAGVDGSVPEVDYARNPYRPAL